MSALSRLRVRSFLVLVMGTVAGSGCEVARSPAGDSPVVDGRASSAIALGSARDCAHTRTAFHCVKYIRNYDGDTLTMEIPDVHPLLGERIGVRVRGIDTPEIKGKARCEKDAARNARRLVEAELQNAKRIDLVDIGRDKYFRIDAVVMVDGKNLGELLIKNNLAYHYNGGTKQIIDWCGRARP